MDIITVDHFNLKETLECGQCFRWMPGAGGEYIGIVGNYVAIVRQEGNQLLIDSNAPKSFWEEYFDLARDYGRIKDELSQDAVMKTAISSGKGIHLLKQPFWECLASFIISQRNNIPRIMQIVEALCREFGNPILFGEKEYYSFPEPGEILDKSLAAIKCGYREKYLKDASEKVLSGQIDYDKLVKMDSCLAKENLLGVNGVGEKVANCVLLFSLQKFDVFPVDVWIKRKVMELYGVNEYDIESFAAKSFSCYSGFAQQYLFYHARTG